MTTSTTADPAALILDALVAPCPECRTRYVARTAAGLPVGECADCTDGITWVGQEHPARVAAGVVALGLARLACPLLGDPEFGQPF